MATAIKLTYKQCKQLSKNECDLRDFINAIENQPDWVKAGGEIDSISELQAIQQGGCASGAYMPAVTYATALDIMNEYGNDVLDYIENCLGELPEIKKGETWSGMAVFYLSYAVELWVNQFDLENVDGD